MRSNTACSRPEERIGRPAFIAVLLALAVAGGPARADIYAYVRPNATVVLTNIVATDMAPAWVIRAPDAPAARARPAAAQVRARYQDEVDAAAREYAVDVDLIHAVIATESNYVSNAVSAKGAVGLMQLMPPTAKRYGIVDSFDALQNIRGGAQHLRHLLTAFDGNIDLVAAAYNAGETAVLKYGRKVPPFPETIRYVRTVQGIYRDRKHSAAQSPDKP
jgi:soluble lytic murein transglycosylase-like protein